MDFFQIKERSLKRGFVEVYPDFLVGRSKDLMIRGKAFYAVWDEKRNIWSTDEYTVAEMVDQAIYDYRDHMENRDEHVSLKTMKSFLASIFPIFLQNSTPFQGKWMERWW